SLQFPDQEASLSKYLLVAGLSACAATGLVCRTGAHATVVSGSVSVGGSEATDSAWIARSNQFATLLIDIEKKHSPEQASADGLSAYDELVLEVTQTDDAAETAENRAALGKLQEALPKEQNKYVKQDLEIMIHATQLALKRHDFAEAHQVPFLNASAMVYRGVRVLLDDQVDAKRKPAAVVRLRKYAGGEPGGTSLTEQLKTFVGGRLAKPNMIFPSRASVETGLSRNQLYVDGIADLFKQYGLKNWEEPYAKLKAQLTDYDQWVKREILPKARNDFREPPELYELNLEGYGVDIPPATLATKAHQAFAEYQSEMQTIAAQIANRRGWPSGDYRDVIKKLKQEQWVGDAILPFY